MTCRECGSDLEKLKEVTWDGNRYSCCITGQETSI